MKSLILLIVIAILMYYGFYDAYRDSLKGVQLRNKELNEKIEKLNKKKGNIK